MSWELSSNGFLMTLSGYVPDLIEEDFEKIVDRALGRETTSKAAVSHWCIHPGGKRILEAIHKSLGFTNGQLSASYKVLSEFGNLSSASILFVLKEMLNEKKRSKNYLLQHLARA
jgi:predicted naringenin-chalcone synthase